MQISKRLFLKFCILAALFLPSPVFSQLCTPDTRCTDYTKCYINNKLQPCAYGSGGASNGGIIFRHGIFYVEWISESRAIVTYGKHKEFKANAKVSAENGYNVLRLSDGVVVMYPLAGGRYAGG